MPKSRRRHRVPHSCSLSQVTADGIKKTFTITRLPRFLILHYRRFQHNNWCAGARGLLARSAAYLLRRFTEKNQTLVNFPLKSLDMKPCALRTFTPSPRATDACTHTRAAADLTLPSAPSEEALLKMTTAEVKALCAEHGVEVTPTDKKADMADKLQEHFDKLVCSARSAARSPACPPARPPVSPAPRTRTEQRGPQAQNTPTKYDLVANICHEGPPDKGSYKCVGACTVECALTGSVAHAVPRAPRQSAHPARGHRNVVRNAGSPRGHLGDHASAGGHFRSVHPGARGRRVALSAFLRRLDHTPQPLARAGVRAAEAGAERCCCDRGGAVQAAVGMNPRRVPARTRSLRR